MKKTLLSASCASCENYVFSKKPCSRIPFKGDFPIVKGWEATKWREEFDSHEYLEDCSDWFRETIAKAMNIQSISCMFDNYLKDVGIDNFDVLPNSDKADWLIRFLNRNSMTIDALNIG